MIPVPKIRNLVASPVDNQLAFATNVTGNYSVQVKVGESGSYLAFCSPEDSWPVAFLSPRILSVAEGDKGALIDLSNLSVTRLPSPPITTLNERVVLADGTVLSKDLREEGKLNFRPNCKLGDTLWGLRDGKVVSEREEVTEGEEVTCSDSSLYIKAGDSILAYQGGNLRTLVKGEDVLGIRASKGKMLFFTSSKVSVFDEPFRIFRDVKTEHRVLDAVTSSNLAYVLLEGYNLPPTILKFDPRSQTLQRFHSQVLGTLEAPAKLRINGHDVQGYVRGDGFIVYVGTRRWSPLFHSSLSVLFIEKTEALEDVKQWLSEKGKWVALGQVGEPLEDPEDFRDYVKYVNELEKKLRLRLGDQ
ncbi:hypothetical protein HS1genome_1079 [Sulfodiicoccus acidiphilus]|uniref:Uncharacterized protein n=1 Tax=Sulfodiicoccus acidiphilus TaxID=1670455 RepID=A0A348B3D8_9CREN|nr:hypothetical protein [Sulfodiicoccus acidiphilus]BBD72690.1 hypothetical protein HS1genome_1079 [Sulfodiicoccus acidiphilus]GGT95480.1 hypothetical protein GCM10007116_11270 [Sulfodiicoccus acidiphilus]